MVLPVSQIHQSVLDLQYKIRGSSCVDLSLVRRLFSLATSFYESQKKENPLDGISLLSLETHSECLIIAKKVSSLMSPSSSCKEEMKPLLFALKALDEEMISAESLRYLKREIQVMCLEETFPNFPLLSLETHLECELRECLLQVTLFFLIKKIEKGRGDRDLYLVFLKHFSKKLCLHAETSCNFEELFRHVYQGATAISSQLDREIRNYLDREFPKKELILFKEKIDCFLGEKIEKDLRKTWIWNVLSRIESFKSDLRDFIDFDEIQNAFTHLTKLDFSEWVEKFSHSLYDRGALNALEDLREAVQSDVREDLLDAIDEEISRERFTLDQAAKLKLETREIQKITLLLNEKKGTLSYLESFVAVYEATISPVESLKKIFKRVHFVHFGRGATEDLELSFLLSSESFLEEPFSCFDKALLRNLKDRFAHLNQLLSDKRLLSEDPFIKELSDELEDQKQQIETNIACLKVALECRKKIDLEKKGREKRVEDAIKRVDAMSLFFKDEAQKYLRALEYEEDIRKLRRLYLSQVLWEKIRALLKDFNRENLFPIQELIVSFARTIKRRERSMTVVTDLLKGAVLTREELAPDGFYRIILDSADAISPEHTPLIRKHVWYRRVLSGIDEVCLAIDRKENPLDAFRKLQEACTSFTSSIVWRDFLYRYLVYFLEKEMNTSRIDVSRLLGPFRFLIHWLQKPNQKKEEVVIPLSNIDRRAFEFETLLKADQSSMIQRFTEVRKEPYSPVFADLCGLLNSILGWGRECLKLYGVRIPFLQIFDAGCFKDMAPIFTAIENVLDILNLPWKQEWTLFVETARNLSEKDSDVRESFLVVKNHFDWLHRDLRKTLLSLEGIFKAFKELTGDEEVIKKEAPVELLLEKISFNMEKLPQNHEIKNLWVAFMSLRQSRTDISVLLKELEEILEKIQAECSFWNQNAREALEKRTGPLHFTLIQILYDREEMCKKTLLFEWVRSLLSERDALAFLKRRSIFVALNEHLFVE